MKKFKYLVFCAMSFLLLGTGANAEEPTDVNLDGAYIIGTHIFTADGPRLTTQNIMLAAKTIESDNIEDMIIYYRLPGDDAWYSTLDNFAETATPEGIKEDGTIEENYFTYIDLEPQKEAIEAQKKFELNSVSNIKTDEIINDQYGQDIKYNQDSIAINNNGNVINVFENRAMKNWNNSVADEQWYALLVDLGVNPANLSSDSYTINQVDYEQANRFGATSDTQFILWLRGSDEATTRVITFANQENGEAVSLTIKFNGVLSVAYETNKKIEVITNGVTYTDGQFNLSSKVSEFTFKEDGKVVTANKIEDKWTFAEEFNFVSADKIASDRFNASEAYYDEIIKNQNAIDVTYEENIITVTKNSALINYVNSSKLQKEWYGIIIDLGIDPSLLKVDGYTIEKSDIEDAKRLGATTDTAFVMWLNGLDETRELVFRHINNSDVNTTVTVNVVTNYPTLNLESVTKLDFTNIPTTESYYNEMLFNNDRVSFNVDGNVITITENDQLKAYNNGYATREWYGFLIDLGIDKEFVSTNEGYIIEEIDKSDAERFGGVGNQFIIWLDGNSTDETTTITFTNANDSNDTLTLTFKFVASHEATANTIEELNAYLIDSNITTINLGQDITDLTSRVVINRPVTINGNNHKLTFTNAINEVAYGERQGIAVISDDVVINDLTVEMDAVQDILSRLDENWDGVYAIQVYNSKNVILNNITATKADGGILVNASEVTLTGTITLSGNEFGGMEVSVGSSLPDATSVLNATEAIFVNETENFRQPTIWSIGDVSLNLDEVFNITTAIKEGETHYYLNGENIIASEITTEINDTYYVNTNLDKPSEITANGSATLKMYKAYSDVRFRIVDVKTPENATIKVWAIDTNKNIWDMITTGWGPETGFPVEAGYTATTPFQIVADTVGEYSATLELYSVSSGEILGSYDISFTVLEPSA